MKNRIFIYHHLGLGDHFHCNGVVRFLLKKKYKNKQVNLFAKKKYKKMIEFMYRDLENLKIIPVSNNEKLEFQNIKSIVKKDDILEKIGFDYFEQNKDSKKTIDMIFYKQYKINYSNKKKLTYWKRDKKLEDKLFKKLIKSSNYIFIHDDPKRNFYIPNPKSISKYQIIRNSYKYQIFDYSKILENAKEVHVMESSIRCMMEHLNTNKVKLYLYNFTNGPWKSIPYYDKYNNIVGSVKNWKIINMQIPKKKSFIKKIFNLVKF